MADIEDRVKWRVAPEWTRSERTTAPGEIRQRSHWESSPATEDDYIVGRWFCQIYIVLNGIGLAALTGAIGNGWWNESPLLNALGAVTGLLALVICFLAGLVWWCITGSQDLAKWSAQAMPWFGQPARSELGILSVFVLLALVAGWVLSRVRSPGWVLLALDVILFCMFVAACAFAILVERGIV